MSYVYKPFPLDSWVSKFYKRLGINTPEDIDERKIARMLSIHLKYSDKRSYSIEDGNFKLINIDKSLDKDQQREVFYHELCHILRHAGSQLRMPLTWRELQEWDAEHFTRYAAIPFHMLGAVDWKSPNIISEMASIFKVSEEVCEYRVEHIQRNMKLKSH